MKVLTKKDLAELGTTLIDPFDPGCLTDLGYDLRAGKYIVVFVRGKEEELSETNPIVIPPTARFAVKTLEKVKLPDDMFAFVFTKVSILYKGLTSLGTKIDPYFQDNLLLIFSNDSSVPFTLKYGEKICNLMFFKYDNPLKEMKPRGLPFLPPIPPSTLEITDAMNYEKIREDFGHGISAIVRYLRPKIRKNEIKLRDVDRFKRRLGIAAVTILTTVVSSVIVWFLTKGVA
jgi:deoxycytidine triphosphate deaminase